MISDEDARRALGEVAQVERRSHLAGAYSQASGHLLIAGLAWAIGFAAIGLTPLEQWWKISLAVSVVAIAGSYLLSWRNAKRHVAEPAARAMTAAQGLWLTAICTIFIVATDVLFHPMVVLPYLVFPSYVMAFVYALVGAIVLPRMLWIGAGVFAVTTAGLVLAPQAIAFWIALAGGGGLILGGLWLRKA
jgi:hypothetical protein